MANGGSNLLFNIGMTGAAAASADISGLIDKFKQLKDAAYGAISSSEDYYDVVNRLSVDMRKFNSDTKGLIDTMTSVRQANALTAAGIKVSAEQMAALGKYSAEFAQATGQDITATFEKMTNAVIRGSSRGLVPFGIQITETTDKTKAQAEALEQLTAKAEGVTVSAEDLNEKVYALQNTMGTLKDQLAAPLFDNVIQGITGSKDGFIQLSYALNTFSDDLTAGGQAFASWATSAEGALEIVRGVWAEITGDTDTAGKSAKIYYLNLQKSKMQEQARREKIEADRKAAEDAAGMVITQEEIDAQIGVKKKRGGGGKKKTEAYTGFDSGLAGMSIFDVTDMSDIEAQQQSIIDAEVSAQAALDKAKLDQWMQDQAAMMMSKQGYDAQELAMQQAKYDAMSSMEKANYDRSQAWAKADAAQKMQIGAGALGATAGLLGQAAALQDTHSKKGFERNKNLMISQVAINTPAAAIGAFEAMAPIPIVGPGLGFAMAAAATGLGIAQMVKIKRQKFGGSGDVSKDSAPRINVDSGAGNQYGAGQQSGGQNFTINLLLDGTVVHSSMLRANDVAAQRGERSFQAA